MPVPKRKTSKSRRDQRSSNNSKKEAKSVTTCQTCSVPLAPHQVCYDCGYYKGVKVIRTKTDRMHERGQARKEKEAKQQQTQDAVLPTEQQEETKK